jgi:hypothetical protein
VPVNHIARNSTLIMATSNASCSTLITIRSTDRTFFAFGLRDVGGKGTNLENAGFEEPGSDNSGGQKVEEDEEGLNMLCCTV